MNSVNFFSIIICCYNSEKYLKKTITSVINQTYKSWELIFINDGSTDKTENIILDFINKNQSLKIKYIKQNNQGFASARNAGIKLAKYKWIAILDHDDQYSVNALEIQNHNINKHKSCNFFFGNHDYFFQNKNIVIERFKTIREKDKFDPTKLNLNKNEAYKNLILLGCFIGSSTVVFEKESCLSIGGFDSKYKLLADYVFFIKMAKINNFYCTNSIICTCLMHDEQAQQKMKIKFFLEMNSLYFSIFCSKNNSLNLRIIAIFKQFKLIVKFLISYFTKNY